MKQVTLFSETDKYGKIIFVNDAFCEIAKYKKEELLNMPHNIIRHPDMPGKLFELLWAAIKRKEIFRAIIKNKAKDSSHYWVRATIAPVLSANNEIIKCVGVRHLIIDDKLAEEWYAQQARDLHLIT
jgi:PAS domain S-box-containing protein